MACLAALAIAGLGAVVPDAKSTDARTEARTPSDTSAAAQAKQARTVATSESRAAFEAWRRTTRRQGYPNGPGWTQAQVQRMARKRRNVKANRRAQKRAGR